MLLREWKKVTHQESIFEIIYTTDDLYTEYLKYFQN